MSYADRITKEIEDKQKYREWIEENYFPLSAIQMSEMVGKIIYPINDDSKLEAYFVMSCSSSPTMGVTLHTNRNAIDSKTLLLGYTDENGDIIGRKKTTST